MTRYVQRSRWEAIQGVARLERRSCRSYNGLVARIQEHVNQHGWIWAQKGPKDGRKGSKGLETSALRCLDGCLHPGTWTQVRVLVGRAR